MINYFTFAGKNSQDFKVYISGQGTYNAPARVYSEYVIPGKSGSLLIDENRFEDVDLTYPAFIFEEMGANIEGLRNYLLSKSGYQRLEDTYHPDEYRLAVFKDGLEADVDQRHEFASFDLTFKCKPQRFLKSGERAITIASSSSPFVLKNPTDQASMPLIRITGTGTLQIGEYSVKVSQSQSYIDIDCEMMDAYNGTTNLNGKVVLTNYNFPKLLPGNNNIVIGSGISSVRITPRWWEV